MASQGRSPEEIAADIARTRDRLAGTIDQLTYRASPKTIAKRQLAGVKAKFVDDDGKVKAGSVAIVAGVVVAVVAGVVVIRKLAG